jgi:hypothetical protein
MALADIWDGLFWAIFVAWQVLPGVVVWRLRVGEHLSRVATLCAAAAVVAGTGLAWYVGLTDESSSTSPLILLVSPAYLLAAVGLIWVANVGVRAGKARLRRP